MGGEIGTSFIFLVEHSAPGNRGFLGSFGPFGIYGGILSGSAVGAAVSITLDRAAVDAWGWRIKFLLGLAVGITGLVVRRYLIEDEAVRDVVVSP